MPSPAIESILMSRSGLKYAEAACIVTRCRSSLGMERFEAWNDTLLAECERVIAKEKGAATTNEALLDVENFFGISDAPTKNRAAFATSANTSGNTEALSRFFGQKVEVSTHNRQGSMGHRQASLRNLMGRRNSQKSMCSLKSNELDVDLAVDSRWQGVAAAAPVATSRAKTSVKTFRPPNTTSSEPSMMVGPDVVGKAGKDTREHHLSDPVNRETAIEALIVRRFGLGFEDAICLVSDARAELRESKFTPWTDDLYFECEKVLGVYDANGADQTSRTEDLSNSSRGSGSGSGNGVIIRESHASSSDLSKGAPKEINFEITPNKREKNTADDQSIGYGSTTGFSGIWTDEKDGEYSVATHDKDDVYSVGVIKSFKLSIEEDEEGAATDGVAVYKVSSTTPRHSRTGSMSQEGSRHSRSGSINMNGSRHNRNGSMNMNGSRHSRSVIPIEEDSPMLHDDCTDMSKSERTVTSRTSAYSYKPAVGSTKELDKVGCVKPEPPKATPVAPATAAAPVVYTANKSDILKPEQALGPDNHVGVEVGCCGFSWFSRKSPAVF